MDLSENLKLAIKAAKEAGKIVMNGFGNIKDISEKAEGKGIVTDVDKKSEETIKKILSNSGFSFLGEEEGKTDNSSDFCWIVDPIDGTTNFSRGIPLFAISVALMKQNKVLLGVSLNPVTNECFYAEEGKGAYLNDKRIHVSKNNSLEGNVLLLNCGYGEKYAEIYSKLALKFRSSSFTRSFGTTVLELCYTACGLSDGFLSPGDELWDYAAGIILVQEAGGKVTDWKGKYWDNSSSFICATNGLIHDEVIEHVKDLQK